jgi:hypothetical protein
MIPVVRSQSGQKFNFCQKGRREELGEGTWDLELGIGTGAHFALVVSMAGPGVNPVQVFRTKLRLHWEFLRLWTGFELPSSCADLP